MIRSATETVFEEFFDLEDTVELGGVYFNIRTYEIVGFIPEEKLKNETELSCGIKLKNLASLDSQPCLNT
ncbi:MAG: hypothetical protein LBV02_05180 [Bacteroidales bacterium]|jgi:hypothetical protein|nr:hypothetical protein [Bacteroidales bacterium]